MQCSSAAFRRRKVPAEVTAIYLRLQQAERKTSAFIEKWNLLGAASRTICVQAPPSAVELQKWVGLFLAVHSATPQEPTRRRVLPVHRRPAQGTMLD